MKHSIVVDSFRRRNRALEFSDVPRDSDYAAPRRRPRVGQTVGIGDIRLSFSPVSRVLIALYVSGEDLVLRINSLRLSLWEPRLRVSRDSDFLCVKRFEVELNGEQLFKMTYLWIDSFDDPLNESLDIASAVAGVAWSPESKARFFFTQRALAKGENPAEPNVRKRLEQEISDFSRSGLRN